MKVVTNDGRHLWALRFGEPGKASGKILCEDAGGSKVTIAYGDIKEALQSYTMPPRTNNK